MKKKASEIASPAMDGALGIVDEAALLTDLRELIQSARQRIVTVANSTTTLLYWHLGRRLLKENPRMAARLMENEFSRRCREN